MAHRNKWFSELKNGGSFHGYVSHNQMVCTIYINLPLNLLLSHWDYGELSQMIMAILTQLLQLGKAKRSAGTIKKKGLHTGWLLCRKPGNQQNDVCLIKNYREIVVFFQYLGCNRTQSGETCDLDQLSQEISSEDRHWMPTNWIFPENLVLQAANKTVLAANQQTWWFEIC